MPFGNVRLLNSSDGFRIGGAPRDSPASLAADAAELWLLRAISPNARPAAFGVEANGAVCTVDRTCRYQIFVSGLSRLLDEAADVCRHINGGGGFLLVERSGQFFTDLDNGAQALVVVDIGRQSSRQAPRPRPKSFWQQVVAFLPWVHDEPEKGSGAAEPESNSASEQRTDVWSRRESDDDINARPVHQLVINIDTGSWPASGVLREMGYKVGKSGLGPSARRDILRAALTVELVATTTEAESYLREWGDPNSRRRASKIKRCLAGFAELHRNNRADYSEAIADWESDLAWFTRECSP